MVAGTVSVDSAGVVTGGDYARALYDALAAAVTLTPPPTPGSTASPYSSQRPATTDDHDRILAGNVRALRALAGQANAIASATVTYMQANAQGKIPATAAGDNLMKDSTNANCKRPATDQFIPIV